MTEPIIGTKSGARGAQMFRRRVDMLFEILDGARHDPHFSRVEPFTVRGADATQYFGVHDDEVLIEADGLEDGKPRHWPIDRCYIVRGSDKEFGNDSIQIVRHRSIDPVEARGKLRIVSRFIIREDVLVVVKEDGVYRSRGGIFHTGLVSRRWVDVANRSPWSGEPGHSPPRTFRPNSEELTARCNISISHVDIDRARWFVEIGREGGFSFKFATTPDKTAAIFRLRDIPDGERRRRALRNWVADHWRSDWRDPEMEVYVRRHLRGAETFSWDGYFCTVHPSVADLELAGSLADERAGMGEQAKRQKFVTPPKPRIRVRAPSVYVPEGA